MSCNYENENTLLTWSVNQPVKAKMAEDNDRNLHHVDEDDSLFTNKFVRAFSPRSREAARSLGVLASECVIRSFESFKEPGVAVEIQKLRYTEYESLRQETIQMVREQRTQLIQEGWAPSLSQPSSRSQKSSSRKPAPKQIQVAADQSRLEKLMARQNKELESMVSYEVKMANLRAKQDHKLETRKLAEKKEKELKREEMLKAIEKKRLWEQTKAEEEAALKLKNEMEAKKLYNKEQKYLREHAKKEEERKQEAKKKQEERQAKRREYERRNAAMQQEQLMMLSMKQEEMDRREAKLAAELEAKKKFMEEVSAEKAKQAAHRISMVLDDKERIIEERRNEVEERMRAQEIRMEQFNHGQEEKVIEQRKQAKAEHEKRVAALEAQKEKNEQRLKALVKAQRSKEESVEKMKYQEMMQRDFRSELGRLNEMRKKANLDRLERQENYRREKLIDKVNQDAAKVREIDATKQRVLKERQLYQIGLVRQKKQLIELFAQIKQSKNWKSMGKLDLAQQLSMSSSTARLPPPKRLSEGGEDEGTAGRSQTAAQGSKRAMRYSQSAPALAGGASH